jgi:hypothetical protein
MLARDKRTSPHRHSLGADLSRAEQGCHDRLSGSIRHGHDLLV